MHKKIVLANNLRVILVPLQESRSVTFSFYVKAGSRFEKTKFNGIAHFLEHLAFQGTEKYPSALELAKVVEGMGGSWNAETDNENINYYIRAEHSHFAKLVELMHQMIYKPLLKEEVITKEKGVIIEEINLYNDMPSHRVGNLVDSLTWPDHPLGRDVAGTKETVSSFSSSDFVEYKNAYFQPSNAVVGLSGKFDEVQARAEIEKHFGDQKDKKTPGFEKVNDRQVVPRYQVENKPTEQTHLCLNFKTFSTFDERKYALIVLSMMLGGGVSSRLFDRIRTVLGLAYYIGAAPSFHLDSGVLQISAGVNNLSCVKALEEIFKVLKDIKTKGSTKDEVERAKEHFKGVLAIQLEDHQKQNKYLSKQELLTDKILTYDEVVKKIDALKVKDIVTVAEEVFVNNGLNLAIVGSQKVEQVAQASAL
ncbi:insulinase family protein [candidate division WWE3 bacterium]|nr:insulinase family protein [candidate division WWE3 bacterium]